MLFVNKEAVETPLQYGLAVFATSGVEGVLLEYGILGVCLIVLGFVVKVLFDQVKTHLANETARADRNEEALRELHRSVQDQMIPAALDMVSTTKSLIDLMAHERARRNS